MNIALLVVTDGRGDYLTRTLSAFDAHVGGPITRRIIHDDSADPAYASWLAREYSTYEIVSTQVRSGYGGALRSAWAHLAHHVDEPYIMALEDDFTFQRRVDLSDLTALLVDKPHLAQLTFRRQPWGTEPVPGGFVAEHPAWYIDCSDDQGRTWIETTRNWSSNPAVYRRELCAAGWPDGPLSEGTYGFHLRDVGLPWNIPGDQVRFGFWGSKETGADWVHHIGDYRVGTGY